MKTKSIILITFLSLSLFSCNVLDKLLTFTISNQTSFKISTGFPLNLATEIITPDVTTNSSS